MGLMVHIPSWNYSSIYIYIYTPHWGCNRTYIYIYMYTHIICKCIYIPRKKYVYVYHSGMIVGCGIWPHSAGGLGSAGTKSVEDWKPCVEFR